MEGNGRREKPKVALRVGLSITGWACTGLAILGIFIPLLPTVPLLLLAAACFARSSEPFHRWLVTHQRLGPLIRTYQGGGGIPLAAKFRAIGLIWLSILFSVYFVPIFWVRMLLVTIALLVSAYLWRLPTRDSEHPD